MSTDSKRHSSGVIERFKTSVREFNDDLVRRAQPISIWTVVWPLLPDPSRRESFREKEKCDICGASDVPLQPAEGRLSRAGSIAPDPDSPMPKNMKGVENKAYVGTTLKRRELMSSAKGDVADQELVGTLKSLMKEKSFHENNVQKLEKREEKLRGDLITAIGMTKNFDSTDKNFAEGEPHKVSNVENTSPHKVSFVEDTNPYKTSDVKGSKEHDEKDKNNVEEVKEQQERTDDNNVSEGGSENNDAEEPKGQVEGDTNNVEESKEGGEDDNNNVE